MFAGVRARLDGSLSPFGVAAAALTALALLLTFHGLGAKSVDLDEAVSVDHARLALSDLWSVVSGSDPNMGFYYVLLHGWLRVFQEGEAVVRGLTALSAGLAVPVVALLGARLFGRPAGLVAGLLLALNAFLIQYAQTARAYGLVVLLVTLSSYFFVAELQQPSRGHRVGWVIASSLSFYSHYFAAYVVLVQLVTLVAVKRRAALSRAWVTAVCAILILCAPEVVFAARAGSVLIGWIPHPNLDDLVRLPPELAGGSNLLAGLLLALGGYGVVRSLRDPERWPYAFVAAWLVAPVLLAFVGSFAQPMFVGYYLIVALPALVLLASAGLVRLPSPVAGVVVLGLLVVLSAGRVSDWYAGGSLEDYRGAARHIIGAMRADDAVVYDPTWMRLPIDFYERQANTPGPTVIDLNGRTALAAHPRRVWLLAREPDVTPEQLQQIDRTMSAAYRRVRGGASYQRVRVELYQRRAAG